MSNDYRELLIGCGHSQEKRMHIQGVTGFEKFVNLTTLDVNKECDPDIWCNLDYQYTERHRSIMPHPSAEAHSLLTAFPYDNTFDEIHAYEVLEHCGRQGDFAKFFWLFGQLWRILKPNGYLCATVPHWQSLWAWGDPGHTRVINEGTIIFLNRAEYDKQLGKTAMSDYRKELGDTNFNIVDARTTGQTFAFILRAIK